MPLLLPGSAQGLLEFRTGRRRRHLPYQADSSGRVPELFPVASRHAGRGVHQLMGQNGCDLHRHQFLDSLRSGRMKISKCRSLLH